MEKLRSRKLLSLDLDLRNGTHYNYALQFEKVYRKDNNVIIRLKTKPKKMTAVRQRSGVTLQAEIRGITLQLTNHDVHQVASSVTVSLSGVVYSSHRHLNQQ